MQQIKAQKGSECELCKLWLLLKLCLIVMSVDCLIINTVFCHEIMYSVDLLYYCFIFYKGSAGD